MKEKQRIPRDDYQYRFETEVCRYIFEDLANHLFYVVIPFTDEFDFPKSEKTRGYGIFSDMIMGFAALRYSIREIDESNHLIADPDDFYDAKILYEGLHGHSDLKFTTPEQNFLRALIELDRTANVHQMSQQMKVIETRVRQIASGRSNDTQKRNGLAAKCASLEVDYVTITTKGFNSKGEDESKSTKKIIYKLDSSFSLMDDSAELIKIKAGSKTLSADRLNTLKHRSNVDITSLEHHNINKINNSKIDVTKSANKEENATENNSGSEGLGICFEKPEELEKNILTCKTAKNGEKGSIDAQHSDSSCSSDGLPTFNDVLSIASKVTSITSDAITLSSNIADAFPRTDSIVPGLEVHAKDVTWTPTESKKEPDLIVRFKTDYESDWLGTMRKFKEGEMVEIPAARTETWIKRGIAEEMSELTAAPDEPANVESSEKIIVAAN